METWEWIATGIAVAAIVLIVLALISIKRRRSHLQDRFGPEYGRAVSGGGVTSGEKDLRAVERKHDELELRPLPTAARDRYLDEWRQAESRFVSDPREAATMARRIVERALEETGYPADGEVEDRVRLVAVDHPDVADRYRHGYAMMETNDTLSTENLRKAMVDFRSVLEDVLHEPRAA